MDSSPFLPRRRLLDWDGWKYVDRPSTNYPHRGDPDTGLAVWWQAHVFVEEAPSVETWWGYAGPVDFRDVDNPVTGYTYWAGDERRPFSVRPGSRKRPVRGVIQ